MKIKMVSLCLLLHATYAMELASTPQEGFALLEKDAPSYLQRFSQMRCKDLADPLMQKLLKMTFKYGLIHGGTLYDKIKKDQSKVREYEKSTGFMSILAKHNIWVYSVLLQAQWDIQTDVLDLIEKYITPPSKAVEVIENLINQTYDKQFGGDGHKEFKLSTENEWGITWLAGARFYGVVKNFEVAVNDCLRDEATKEQPAIFEVAHAYWKAHTKADTAAHTQEYWDIQDMFDPEFKDKK